MCGDLHSRYKIKAREYRPGGVNASGTHGQRSNEDMANDTPSPPAAAPLSRHEGNQWMGLGTIPTCASLLAEADNMTALGANHADKDHWTDLGLPFADFLLNVRVVLTK